MPDIKPYSIYTMEIIRQEGSFYFIRIKKGRSACSLVFNPVDKVLRFPEENILSKELEKNKYQLNKILRNKRNETFFVGFRLKFILRDNNLVIALNDLSKLVVLDRRKNDYKVYSKEKDEKEILKIYTDGCYLEKKRKGAYIALIEKTDGKLNLHFSVTKASSSSLIELMAVIEGLKQTGNIEEVRIIADSRYVIKGLTEWMFNWKLNNWHTAQGKKVKNIQYWKEFDKLTRGKYIEFEWVKGHSNHFENSICDFYAKQAAGRI